MVDENVARTDSVPNAVGITQNGSPKWYDAGGGFPPGSTKYVWIPYSWQFATKLMSVGTYWGN